MEEGRRRRKGRRGRMLRDIAHFQQCTLEEDPQHLDVIQVWPNAPCQQEELLSFPSLRHQLCTS